MSKMFPKPKFPPRSPLNKLSPFSPLSRLFCGDFNSLTPSDYPAAELAAVAAVRRANRWEEPRSAVTDRMKGALGFRDAMVGAAATPDLVDTI